MPGLQAVSKKLGRKRKPGRKKGPLKINKVNEDGLIETIMDPRQKMMWDAYIDPRNRWFNNAYRCALAAGYGKYYSLTITSQRFFQEKIRRLNMLSKAEKVFDKTLSMETTDNLGKEQSDLLRIQTDVAKHVSKTLGKDEGYSERTEMTGKGGNPIVFLPMELMDKYKIESSKEN